VAVEVKQQTVQTLFLALLLQLVAERVDLAQSMQVALLVDQEAVVLTQADRGVQQVQQGKVTQVVMHLALILTLLVVVEVLHKLDLEIIQEWVGQEQQVR
jgi:hypothetical protein